MLWQNLEQYELAQRDWDQVIHLAPDTLEAYVGRALCWRAAGKWERAVEDLTSALKLDQDWQPGYIARGKAHTEAQDFAAAKADIEHAVRLNDKDVAALNALAYFLVTCSEVRFRDYRRGVDVASRCCELTDGKSFDHLAMLATAYAQAGRFADAVKWQSEALRFAPDDQADGLTERLAMYRRGEQPFPAQRPSATR
jgi:tetratricopeptide (TPR) repeat protein